MGTLRNITFQNTKLAMLKPLAPYKTWIDRVIKSEQKEYGSIAFFFLTDDELKDINIRFLSHDYYTDIITFDYSTPTKVSGEIYISVDRVFDNAAKLKEEPSAEMKRVIIHGILHLCGYKDKSPKDKAQMTKKEDYALSIF